MFFFFNDTATTEIYTLSLHDALPIWGVTSLVGLGITVVVLAEFVVPGILSGASPLLVSVLGALVIAVASIYLAHGFSRRTSIAVASTLITLTLSAFLAAAAVSVARLFGSGTE